MISAALPGVPGPSAYVPAQTKIVSPGSASPIAPLIVRYAAFGQSLRSLSTVSVAGATTLAAEPPSTFPCAPDAIPSVASVTANAIPNLPFISPALSLAAKAAAARSGRLHLNPDGLTVRAGASQGVNRLTRAPAAEHEAAEREPEPERADGEAADRDRLAPGRQALPAAERLVLLGRQLFAAALLAQSAAGAKPEVQVVEDLGRVVSHRVHESIASFGRGGMPPPCIRSPHGYTRGSRGRGGARRSRAQDRAGADRRVGRSHEPRPARAARARCPLPPLTRRPGARGAR